LSVFALAAAERNCKNTNNLLILPMLHASRRVIIERDNDSSKQKLPLEILCPLIVACRNRSILLKFGKKVLNQMACFVQVHVIVTRGSALRLGGITAVLLWCSSRAITRSSASNPLSASSVSAASSLSRKSAPSRSQGLSGV
jgi:hypothetical protein